MGRRVGGGTAQSAVNWARRRRWSFKKPLGWTKSLLHIIGEHLLQGSQARAPHISCSQSQSCWPKYQRNLKIWSRSEPDWSNPSIKEFLNTKCVLTVHLKKICRQEDLHGRSLVEFYQALKSGLRSNISSSIPFFLLSSANCVRKVLDFSTLSSLARVGIGRNAMSCRHLARVRAVYVRPAANSRFPRFKMTLPNVWPWDLWIENP